MSNFFESSVASCPENLWPPTNFAAIPIVVQRAQTDMEQFVTHYPHWLKDTGHILTYQNKKARIREAWDSVQLKRKLQISFINVHTANEANAPRKPLYRRIFHTGVQTRVEPMFV